MKYLFKLILILSIGFPLFFALRNIANMPFWFDSARDFLLAEDNLKKISLIGPPTGIPGIFYGPYWIWLISLGLIFSIDPSFVVIYLLIIPYFVIFPFLLFKFAKIFGKEICLMLWLLFIVSYIHYTTFLWNPNLAPVLLLLLFVLVVFHKPDFSAKNIDRKIFFIGLINGLIMNFHVSLGIGILLSTFVFFIFEAVTVSKRKLRIKDYFLNRIIALFLFLLGLTVAFLPSIAFELRHDFQQTKIATNTIVKAIFYNIAPVGITGFKTDDILKKFFLWIPGDILRVPSQTLSIIYLLTSGILFYYIKRGWIKFNESEKRLVFFSLVSGVTILYVFLSSKNPVWDYHFIGVEIIFLLIIGFLIHKIIFLRKILLIWIILIVISFISDHVKNPNANPRAFSSLGTKKYIANKDMPRRRQKSFHCICLLSSHLYL